MRSALSSRHAGADVSGAEFAMLLAPSANRVYAEHALDMLLGEMTVFDHQLLDGTISSIRVDTVSAAPCLRFEVDGLTRRDLDCLQNLSSSYVLFSVHDDLLRPVTGKRLDRYDDDLLTILKYRGKTNEQFTKLLVNVTAAALGSAEVYLNERLRVLDPLCGRGTTLNQAIMYGWDAYGVDIDRTDTETYSAFIRRWLKDKRLKHTATESRLRRDGRTLGRRFSVRFAGTNDGYKTGLTQTVDVSTTDTMHSAEVHRSGFFDLIVTDVPYGIRHGATGTRAKLSRNPTALLRAAIPEWATLLRGGGAIGVAWNTHHTSRQVITSIMAAEGLEVLDGERYERFRHRVDHAIDRDLIVARNPRSR